MAKIYKLIVLFLGLSAMSISIQAQVSTNSAVSPSSTKLTLTQSVNFTNYPNPAKTETTIAYNLATNAKVVLRVVDLTGKQLALLVKQDQAAGKQEYYWDLSKHKITSGMYIIVLQVDNKTYTRKVIVQ